MRGGQSDQLIKVLRGHPHIAKKPACLQALPVQATHQVSRVRRRAVALGTNENKVGQLYKLHQLRRVPHDVPSITCAHDRKKSAPRDRPAVQALGIQRLKQRDDIGRPLKNAASGRRLMRQSACRLSRRVG